MNQFQTGNLPFVFNKDLGTPLNAEEDDFTRTNSESKPVIELTPEQIYLFDTKGWLLVPGLLVKDEIEDMRSFITQLHQKPESIPKHERSILGGPTQQLIDHPMILGFANKFIYTPPSQMGNNHR